MGTPKRAKGGGQPPPGAKKKLHWPKEWEGKGEIYAQAKISSKREKEREELMEPEETVAALKRRERVRSKKKREEDRGRKGRRVEMEIREKGGSGAEESTGGQTQRGAMEECM